MRLKTNKFIYYISLVTLSVILTLLFQSVFAQSYVPITNYHNGISVGIQGTQGSDYIFDRYYFDPLVNDCGVCYIKSDVDITLSHNSMNSRLHKQWTFIRGGDFGIIRYKMDRDWQDAYRYSGSSGHPAYTGPFSFNDLQYEAGVPVVGTTGFNPGYAITDKQNSYSRGMLDQAGNEYHYMSYFDDDKDGWAVNDDGEDVVGTPVKTEESASDGKSMLFCVNPKTPAIWLNAATIGAQYYTTPAKVWWIPKIHEQTSYVMDDVNINLKNIMNSNTVYYRIDGGSYQAYTGPISSNTLNDGTHILEFYYNSSNVQTRKIVKNPQHPSKNETFADGSGHGYLFWKNDAEFLRWKDRMLNGVWSNDGYYPLHYKEYKDRYLTDLSYSGNGGIRNKGAGNSLMYAIVGVLEGVAEKADYMKASKIRLLANARMHIETIGWETNHDYQSSPTHEITYRGYVDDELLWQNALTYDILAKYYRSDQHPDGMTPIEDLRLRDMIAAPAHELMMYLGKFKTWEDANIVTSPFTSMWITARANAAVCSALAMPGYNNNYYGTSGFDGTQATHSWTPYPDYTETWKDAFYTYADKDISSHISRLHTFPNRARLFNWHDGGLIKENGDWYDKAGYGTADNMGHGMELFLNIMKRKFNVNYESYEAYMDKSLDGTVYCNKEPEYAGYARGMMANEYFPNLAPRAIDYKFTTDKKYLYVVRPYYFFFHNPDWENTPACQSSIPPTVPANIAGTGDVTSISLSWSASTHECSVSAYKIKRDGVEIATVAGTQYTDAGLSLNTQYNYSVAAVSEAGVTSAYSAPVQLTTLNDNEPPTIVNVPNSDISTLVIIEFNEELDAATAGNASNYALNNGISVSSADLQIGNKVVKLTVSAMNVGTSYTVTVNNVKDINGNTIAANSSATFTCVQPSANLALNKPVTADSELSAEYAAEKAVDGITNDNASRWISGSSTYPHWIEIDLLQTTNVDKVDFYTGHTSADYIVHDYQIQYWDGNNWIDAVSVTGNNLADVSHSFSVVSTNKLRLYCTAGQDNIVRLFEIEAYNNSGSTTIGVTGVSISQPTLSLNEGQASELIENVSPSNATNKSVNWSSDNTSVATVDANGVVSALSAGQAIITVTTVDGSFTANCSVTVNEVAGDVNLALGKSVTVSSEPQPENGAAKIVDDITTDDSRWSAENFPQWAEVDLGENCIINSFEVYPYSDRDYQYIIEISDDGINYSTVVDRSSNTETGDVFIDNVATGGRYVKITLSGANSYTGDWASITELKVFGSAAGGTVSVTGVSLLPANITIDEGQTSELTETVSPSNATDKSVSWSSDNTSVATVDANGIVSAVSTGTATITVTTTDDGFVASCSVTVNAISQMNEYYCDPVNGSMSNNGSQESPWSTLEDVFNAGKTFEEGDIIYLLSGYHGSVVITNVNTGNVTIQAANGATPELRNIDFSDAAYWTVTGLKISPDLASTYQTIGSIVDMNSGSGHIIVEDCEIFSIDNNSSWSATDWVNLSCNGVFINGDNNIVRNCTIRNIDHGIFIDRNGDNNLIENNLVKNFSGDGMRGIGSYNTFQYNRIQDNYNVDSNHDDGFQSYSIGADGAAGTGTVYSNVLRGNVIINTTDPNRAFTGPLQGMGNFDGMFEDWIIENNLIVCDHYHGITFLGAKNCTIINNTVVDNNPDGPGPAWIQIEDHKDGTPSTGNIIRNNICTDMNNATNIGIVENNLEITFANFSSHFVDYANNNYRLIPSSSAIDAGTSTGAPTVDLDGISRPQGGAFDIGAYEYIASGPIAVSGVTINPVNANLNVGGSIELTGIISPASATDKSVSWSSSNTSIATVDANGLVMALAEGSCVVTVTTNDGGFSANCNVIVSNGTSINLALGKPVTVDSELNTDYVAENAVDGVTNDNASRWISASSAYPHWIEIDLQQTADVDRIDFYTGHTNADYIIYDYQIQYWDGSNWIDIVSVTGNSLADVSHSFASVSTDKLRLYYTAGQDNIVRLFEIEAYGSSSSSISVTGVSVMPTSLSLNEGETSELAETVSPVDATDKSVTWSSSNTSIATVDANGLVSALSAGSATITVTTNDGSFTANCALTVNPVLTTTLIEAEDYSAVNGCVIANTHTGFTGTGFLDYGAQGTYAEWSSISGGAGGPASLTIRYANGSSDNRSCDVMVNGQIAGNITVNPTGDWTNWVTETVNVNLNGGAVNTVRIIASTSFGGPNIDNFEVTVNGACNQPVTSVSVNTTSASLVVQETISLTAAVLPVDACDMSVTWSSANSTIASVDANGQVTANAAGRTTITVTTNDGNFTANCAITVVVPVTGVSVSLANISIDEGQTLDLNETVSPANATNKMVTWSSNNTSVATVNSSGLVTAVSAGTATITVTTNDGGNTASCNVTVTVPVISVTGVSISASTMNIYEGQSSSLSATVIPSNATDQSVLWSSDNTSVATVDASGMVNAIASGTATITVTTNDGGYTATCNVTVSTIVLENLALGKPATADSEYNSSYPASNAVDGDNSSNSSRWISANTSYPHWIEIDLQETCEVSTVNLWTGYYDYRYPVYDYQIQYWDGTNWTDIVNVTGNSDAVVSHTFTAVSTDKIRLYCTAGADNLVRLFEIEVWGYTLLKSHTTGKFTTNGSHLFECQVFPNPIISNSFQLILNNGYELNNSLELRIFDMTGKILFVKQIQVLDNSALKTIEVNSLNLKKGLYMINISDNKTIVNKKIVIR